MDVFDLRNRLVGDYSQYTTSFIKIRDQRIKDFVHGSLDAGAFWPEPLLQLNPTFKPGGLVEDLTADGTLHPECARMFRIDKTEANPIGHPLRLHTHQTEAIRKAREGKSYVLTSGTGSGKSLSYIVPDRGPRAEAGSGQGHPGHRRVPDECPGKQSERGAPQVSAPGLRRQAAGTLCALHGAGARRRAQPAPRRSARYTADQLHDAGVGRSPVRTIGPSSGRLRGCASWCSTKCTPIGGARALTWRC